MLNKHLGWFYKGHSEVFNKILGGLECLGGFRTFILVFPKAPDISLLGNQWNHQNQETYKNLKCRI